jgi:hypothetical protein
MLQVACPAPEDSVRAWHVIQNRAPPPTFANICAFEVSTFECACCASMQSLRSSAVRAFGSVAKGHGAHDIKNPTADVTISIVLGKHSCCAGFERSASLFCCRERP